MSTILSFDISTVSTGWALYKKNKLFKSGVIKIKDTIDIYDRMLYFKDKVLELVHKFKPSIILIEDVFFSTQNPKTSKTLAKFGGIAEESLYRVTGKKPIIIGNIQVKTFFKCKNKCELFKFIVDLLEMDLDFKDNNDRVDAIAQGLYYLDREKLYNVRIEKPYGFLYNVDIT